MAEQPFDVQLESHLLLDSSLDGMASRRPSLWAGRSLCGGPAKIKTIDAALAAEAIAKGVRSPNPSLLDADWLATKDALFYVTPRVRSVFGMDGTSSSRSGRKTRWKFSGVSSISLMERSLTFERVEARPLCSLGWATGLRRAVGKRRRGSLAGYVETARRPS